MKTIKSEKRLCECCMEEHEVKTVIINDSTFFKGEEITFDSKYYYCDNADEYFEDEVMLDENDISLKNEYRKKMGLLTSDDIHDIRDKYKISQHDLAVVLGWGAKTITRYESHQVQDPAHDAILHKIDDDPEWFLVLLESAKGKISSKAYLKYFNAGKALYEADNNSYLKKAILSRYAKISGRMEYTGSGKVDFNKIVDIINYFAGSAKVKALYKVKLMKMLWYSDALSFKTNGHSLTGMAYQCLKMGAVPLAYDLIIELNGINYEEVEVGDGIACKFVRNSKGALIHLTEEDKEILDRVIERFGASSKDEIVESMHRETAYKKTRPRQMIDYRYAEELSL